MDTPGIEALKAGDDPAPGLRALLALAAPVRGRAAAWLKSRRIFRRTWEAHGLRVVDDYRAVSEGLRARFPLARLQAWGLLNPAGNLRCYRHTLLLPYFDQGEPVSLQARTLDPDVVPRELSLGPVTVPYNAALLDGTPGRLYLCEGAMDTLSLLEAGFPAVGIPDAADFKPSWTERFREKIVFVAFDADAAGEAGAARVIALLAEGGVEAHRLQVPPGKDLNEWLRSGGLGIRLDAGEEPPARPGRRTP
ncbi:MAG TPA: toprim domain-containing protein [Fibrobacteria bacterium]|jgi:DNA primase|nr:toprim domain-containing protein [Fibrobacteria bacterium]